jgi:hypothetical protein
VKYAIVFSLFGLYLIALVAIFAWLLARVVESPKR